MFLECCYHWNSNLPCDDSQSIRLPLRLDTLNMVCNSSGFQFEAMNPEALYVLQKRFSKPVEFESLTKGFVESSVMLYQLFKEIYNNQSDSGGGHSAGVYGSTAQNRQLKLMLHSSTKLRKSK